MSSAINGTESRLDDVLLLLGRIATALEKQNALVDRMLDMQTHTNELIKTTTVNAKTKKA